MRLHLILLMVLSQCWSVRTSNPLVSPLVSLTNYLHTKTERGCQGEVVHITCGPGNKVTAQSLTRSKISNSFLSQISIQSVLVGSQPGSDPCGGGAGVGDGGGGEGRCEAQSDQGQVQRQCQGRQECSFHVSGSLLESQSLPCSGDGDR